MKKLLTILTVVLALCLAFGVAMADDDTDSDFRGEAFEEAMRTHTIDGHTVGDYTVMREPTCTQKGIIRFACETQPDHFHEVYTDMLPHQYAVVDDCTTGSKCKVCGQTVPGHHIWSSEWNNWSASEKAKYLPYDYDLSSKNNDEFFWGKVIKEPTCTEEGEAIDFCPRCGATREVTRVIEKVPHDFSVIVTDHEPICLDGEEYWEYHHECKYCGEPCGIFHHYGTMAEYAAFIKDPDYDGHAWDNWFVTVEPTCAKEGTMVRLCPRCGDKQEKPIEKLKPEWVKISSRLVDCYTEEVTEICKLCGSKAPGHEARTYTNKVVAHEFVQTKDYLVETVPATCEKDGYYKYRCIHWNTAHTGHDEAEHSEEDGYLKVTIPMLGHDWSKWELRYDSHYNGQDNVNSYWLRECKRCHKTEERVSEYAPEDACEEHQYVYHEEYDEPATCDEAGKKVYICSVCGNKKFEEVEPTGHVWTDPIVIEEPSYYADGLTVKVCTVCGDTEYETLPQFEAGKVEQFVIRCYETILGREADAGEVAAWTDDLKAGTKNAADIVSGFVNSKEFVDNEDNDLVETLYGSMLDRESDEDGYRGWTEKKNDGLSTNYLVNGFAGSKEFQKLCDSYGINAGSVETEARDVNPSVTAFVTRCYREALGRDGDPEGLNNWTSQLTSGTNTPQGVAYGFVFSPEFNAGERLTNGEAEDVITALYGLYLDREPDDGGLAYWINRLEEGMTLEELNNGFADSKEFNNIVLTYNMYPEAK